MFRRPQRVTHFDSRVEHAIESRLDDAGCDRLDDVIRALAWILERQPDNDRAVALDVEGAWLIKTEALPGLESPSVTLIYRFDDRTVHWWMIRIECFDADGHRTA